MKGTEGERKVSDSRRGKGVRIEGTGRKGGRERKGKGKRGAVHGLR